MVEVHRATLLERALTRCSLLGGGSSASAAEQVAVVGKGDSSKIDTVTGLLDNKESEDAPPRALHLARQSRRH